MNRDIVCQVPALVWPGKMTIQHFAGGCLCGPHPQLQPQHGAEPGSAWAQPAGPALSGQGLTAGNHGAGRTGWGWPWAQRLSWDCHQHTPCHAGDGDVQEG